MSFTCRNYKHWKITDCIEIYVLRAEKSITVHFRKIHEPIPRISNFSFFKLSSEDHYTYIYGNVLGKMQASKILEEIGGWLITLSFPSFNNPSSKNCVQYQQSKKNGYLSSMDPN